MDKISVGIVSLGCDKNRVDSEYMIGVLKQGGFVITDSVEQADVIIINTCAFILPARKEAIDTILEMAEYKTLNCKKLVVTGCLPQKYIGELVDGLPEVDCFLGISHYNEIDRIIKQLFVYNKRYVNVDGGEDPCGERVLTTPSHFAYLKIADGCDNHCTYCTIPSIRGKYRSYRIEALVEEANALAQMGVKELILVAQDVTNYGVDLYGSYAISDLVARLSKVEGIEWIRLLYCYPERIDDAFINMLAHNDKVVKYLDVPIQHSSDRTLKLMGRRSTRDSLVRLFNRLKSEVPDIVIRTTIMIGFPGETLADFHDLTRFIREMQFLNVGFFIYSDEDTPSASLYGKVFALEAKRRLNRASLIQADITDRLNREAVGKTFKAIIDSEEDNISEQTHLYTARTYRSAPEIDGICYVQTNKTLEIGGIYEVTVYARDTYDLYACLKGEKHELT